MDEKELLKSMSDIKEEYVVDAAKAAAPKKKTSWKAWAGAVAAVFVLVIGIGALMPRMGASKSASTDMAFYDEDAPMAAPTEMFASGASDMATKEYAYATEESEVNDVFKAYEAPQPQKLIKTANISIQTTEFADAETALYNLVAQYNGYFESKNIENGSYYSDGSWKYGYYTVRIPVESYDAFMGAVGEGCHVVNVYEGVEDISDQYYDTATRLETLEIKMDRLQDLLKKASNLSDIITLESEISNTQYEIDSLTGTLKRYDSKVDYATINVNIEQVSRVDDGVNQNNGFFARLLRNLKNGVINFIDSIAGIFYWAAYNIIGIALVVVAIVLIKKYHLIKKFLGLFKKKEE